MTDRTIDYYIKRLVKIVPDESVIILPNGWIEIRTTSIANDQINRIAELRGVNDMEISSDETVIMISIGLAHLLE